MNDDRIKNMTLDYYNRKALEFFKGTVSLDFEERHNMLLKYLSQGTHILDLGCGPGRDSRVFINKGYKVTAIDGSTELCKIASNYIGQKVICMSFQDLCEIEIFDAVWACASILHVPLAGLNDILYKIIRSLKQDGYFYASFKYGEFEGIKSERYFTDFTEKTFKSFLESFSELQIIEVEISRDLREAREDEKWLNVIMKKICK